MKKVLFAASNPAHIRNFHRPYIAWLADQGWQVWLLCGGSEPVPGVYRALPYPFQKRMWSPVNFRTARKLAALLRQERFDLVYVHTSLAAFFVRLAVRMAGKGETRVVNMCHGYLFDDQTPPVKRRLLLTAERLTAPVTDLLLVMNDCDLRLAEKHRLAARVVKVDGVGVDFGRFTPRSRTEARRALGVGDGDFLLLYPAEFSKRKNQPFLLRGLKLLPQNVKLALCGSGAGLSGCQALAARLGLGGRVLFPGQVADLSDWYAAADLCVSASRYEGLPFNIMEGMYAARPIVASQIKGHADLVGEGVCGFLYPYGDEDAFADCVKILMGDQELRRIMGEKGRARAETYALDRVLPQVIDALAL